MGVVGACAAWLIGACAAWLVGNSPAWLVRVMVGGSVVSVMKTQARLLSCVSVYVCTMGMVKVLYSHHASRSSSKSPII